MHRLLKRSLATAASSRGVGAFVSALRAGVPVVPVLLEGAGGVWKPGSFAVRGRHEIRVAVLDPIPTTDLGDSSAEDLSELVRRRLLEARNLGKE